MPAYRDPLGSGVPGPYVTLRIAWGNEHRDIQALVDTGADVTQIPRLTAEALGLEHVDDVPVYGVNEREEEAQEKPVFIADLEFEGIQFDKVSVVGDDRWAVGLIGRDLLAELHAAFEGPAQQFSVFRPGPPAISP